MFTPLVFLTFRGMARECTTCRIGTWPEALRCLDPVGSKHLRAEGLWCLYGLENVAYTPCMLGY